MTDEDLLLVRRLQMRVGDCDFEGCLTGVGGADLFDRLLVTGRARWASVHGPALHRLLPIEAKLGWADDDLGRTRLVVEGILPHCAVVLLSPPVCIDTVTGAVAPLDLSVSPAMAEQLLRLPPIDAGAVAALAERWHEFAPPSVPAPTVPEVRDLGILTPTPILSLRMDQVELEDHYNRRHRYASKMRVACAVARLGFDYAGTIIDAATAEGSLMVRGEQGLVRFTRDPEAEFAGLARLLHTGLIPLVEFDDLDPAPRQDWDYAPELPATAQDFTSFLLDDAEMLRTEGWRIEVAPDFPLRIVAAEPDSLSVDVVPSGIDWFDIELGATIDGARIDLVPALRRLLTTIDVNDLETIEQEMAGMDRLFPVALGNGKVVTVEAARVLPLLRALLMLAANDGSGASKGRPGFSPLDLGLLGEIEATTPNLRWAGGDQLRRLARELTQLRLAETQLPDGFEATLWPYQQTGLDWLEALARAGLGGLLADDMGLGKTVQTLAHIAAQRAGGSLEKPVLIVAPTSVLPNWQAEIERFAPVLSSLLSHGPDRHDHHETIAGHDIVLTSYPLLVRDAAMFAKESFGLVVFDEAHMLKNSQTASHAAAKGLIADRKIALTGTPVENRLTDAWALFELVVPGLLGSKRDFVRDYRNPIEKHGDTAAKVRLARKLRPFMLRRTKDEVASDLPAKSVVPLSITLGAAQMALHESQRILMQERVREEIARVGLMRSHIMVLTALTRLRQVCCDPRLLPGQETKSPGSAKLERLLDLVDEMIAEGRRIILFSQFTSMLDLIKPELDRRQHEWVELTGKTKDRKTPVARFQSGEVPLILVSLKAGGTGLNLTAADTVILYDPWWNPALEAQAIDRAHRIGQQKPVFVYRMIATGTIEEKILALQQRKSALAEALWSEDAATPAHLTEDDIAFLLS
ncbi:DEAD/DEAH box helicase [Sphingomonas sp. UYP23]